MIKAGLARNGQRGPIDSFHRRLLWTIRDAAGDVVGFGARRLFDDDRLEAKYVNTSETPLYHKSQVLYGLDLAKKDISRSRQVVVVEGYTDVMAMHLAGVTTAVASCGTAFGDEHISVLRRYLARHGRDTAAKSSTSSTATPPARRPRSRRSTPTSGSPPTPSSPSRRTGWTRASCVRPRATPRCGSSSGRPSSCSPSPSRRSSRPSISRRRRAGRTVWPRRSRWSPGSRMRPCGTGTPGCSPGPSVSRSNR